MIGTTLDKYEVLQKVGEGGMATVYLGRHNTLNRDVAIKVLHPHLSSSTRNRKRFAREARAIEHLHHDNILEIFDYSGVDAHECYIITEFVQGQTLSDILRERGRLPSEVASIMGLHLARALAYAHQEGILHRDLKPDNVMVRWDGTVKLMDFGIARFLDESQVTMTGALVGSPAFMSPEQAREQPLDGRSDLFSLGTMLFYLVTGHLPFSGSNPSLILKNVIESNRPVVSELAPTMSAGMADLIERLMANNPDDRHKNADDVASAMEAVLAEANVEPEDSRWHLRGYLEDADAFENRLDDHLRQILIVRGKQHLEAGDHLAALRLFNRLLSMDEDNEEVLDLVQGLHGEPRPIARQGAWAGLIVALGLLGATAFAASKWGDPTEIPPPVPAAVVAPTPVAPEPIAVVAPEPMPVVEPAEPEPQPAPLPPGTVVGRRIMPAPTPVVEEPEDTDRVAAMGKVRFRAGELIGTLIIDDTRVGTTRDIAKAPIDLTVGEHTIEVKGERVLDWEKTIFVADGEIQTVRIDLEPRPAMLNFPRKDYVGDCGVFLDNNMQGSLDSLGYRLLIKEPREKFTVRVACDNGVQHEKKYQHITDGEDFPPPTV